MLIDYIGWNIPADLADHAELAYILNHFLLVDILFDIFGVAGRPYLQAGAEIAVAERSPLSVLIDRNDLDLVAHLFLEQNLCHVDIDRRPRPGVFGQLERDLGGAGS